MSNIKRLDDPSVPIASTAVGLIMYGMQGGQTVKVLPSLLESDDPIDGINGKSAYEVAVDNGFVGTPVEWLESLNGDVIVGVRVEGDDIIFELDTQEEIVMEGGRIALRGEKGPHVVNAAFVTNNLVFTLSDNSTVTIPNARITLKGDKGDKGDKGEKGDQGIQGTRGEKGDKGDKGDTGESFTYDMFTPDQLLALKGKDGSVNFEELTEEQIATLKGEKGDTGDAFTYDMFTPEQLALLKGEKGDKGDIGEQGEAFTYNNFTPEQLEALKGEDFRFEHFTVEQLEALRVDSGTISYEDYKFITSTIEGFNVDYLITPQALLALDNSREYFSIWINNVPLNRSGSIVIRQYGGKKIILENIKGEFEMPKKQNDMLLIKYINIDGILYGTSSLILPEGELKYPQKIEDLVSVYNDSMMVQLKWTAPYANNITDPVSFYEIGYSNNLIDSNDPSLWIKLKKITGSPVPKNPDEEQTFSIEPLIPGTDYYFYIRSVKINYGTRYTSDVSNPVHIKTNSTSEQIGSARINLTPENLIPRIRDYSKTIVGGEVIHNSIDKLVDDKDKIIYLDTGYPDIESEDSLSNLADNTYWEYSDRYGRETVILDIYIDLFNKYTLSNIYISTDFRIKFSIYIMKDYGYTWEKIGTINDNGYRNRWLSLDLKNTVGRFLKISFDQTNIPGGFVDPMYGEFEKISNVILYGTPVNSIPYGIKEPRRRLTTKKTVDQFLCTNGHFYQQGRIHSMFSGEKVRLYGHFGHFAPFDPLTNVIEPYESIADLRFRVNQIPWTMGNNGSGETLEQMLRNTYKKYGLKPYLCNTGVYDTTKYDSTITFNRQIDNYWYPNMWRAVPQAGVGGLDDYFAVTKNPNSYKTVSKLAYALAAKYGNNANLDGSNLFYPLDESTETGLDLISGIEIENEPDKDWEDWVGFTDPEECSAVISAVADGNYYDLKDELENTLKGTREGNILSIASGLAGANDGYILSYILANKYQRKTNIPAFDVINFHMYTSIKSLKNWIPNPVEYGVTYEEAINNSYKGDSLRKIVELRDRLYPDKEIWITEFGWGEAGAPNTSSHLQCYSKAGRLIGNWLVPDRHRSDVKGSYIVRAVLTMMGEGIDMCNLYSTECEGDYFDNGQWGSGAGFEMFHWEDIVNVTPGDRVANVEPYVSDFNKGGFSAIGLFGSLLTNGAYPITRAFWYVATFRNRLKGYIFKGFKSIEQYPNIKIAVFQKVGTTESAYAIYLNSTDNNGIPNVAIPIPNGNSTVTKVETYVPNIPNPDDVPNTIGNDQIRTGMPTARREKYINGEWVIQNKKPDSVNYESFSLLPATYPDTPIEGDEVIVLPSEEENPYYPIVGSVGAKKSNHGITTNAAWYEIESSPMVWEGEGNLYLAWRQVDAVCDYIDYHPEGIKGKYGVESQLDVVGGFTYMNVTEFPEYIFFDGIVETDFNSKIENLVAENELSNIVKLYWNNTNIEDETYEVFGSTDPEAGFVQIDTQIEGNIATISDLTEGVTYYFKVRPKKGTQTGDFSESVGIKVKTFVNHNFDISIVSKHFTYNEIGWNIFIPDQITFKSYIIYRSDEFKNFIAIEKIDDISKSYYKDEDVIAGKLYYYKVKAILEEGETNFSNELEVQTITEEQQQYYDLKVNGVVINNGNPFTIDANVSIDINYSGIATHYCISDNEEFIDATWFEVTPEIIYTLDEVYGYRLIYLKLKNHLVESNVVSEYIEYYEIIPVTLNNITLNNGLTYTGNRNVNIEFNYFGTPTHYKIGESEDLSLLEWIPYTGAITYTVSDGYGIKTLYSQMKGDYNESLVVSNTIEYIQPVELTSIILGIDNTQYEGARVPVQLVTIGGSATHFRLGESVDLSSVQWLPIEELNIYEFDSLGVKTLYGQVKGLINESIILSQTIEVLYLPTKALVSFIAEYPKEVTTQEYNGLVYNITVPRADRYSNLNKQYLTSTAGELLTWKVKPLETDYPINSISTVNIPQFHNVNGNIAEGVSGVHPIEMYKKCWAVPYNHPYEYDPTTETKKCRWTLDLPLGNYVIKILYSPGSSQDVNTEIKRSGSRFAIYQGETQIALQSGIGEVGYTAYMENDFNVIMEFEVTEASPITLAIWNTLTVSVPGMNLLEITKLEDVPLIEIASINIVGSSTVNIGKTIVLQVDYLPINTIQKGVYWSSSSDLIATVDFGGRVTPISEGTVTITATSIRNASIVDTFDVTVLPAV